MQHAAPHIEHRDRHAMSSSSSPVVILSDSESDGDDDDGALSRPAAESFTSCLTTQADVDALCQEHGVPAEFAARPAGERRACTLPPPGAVFVYSHALEAGLRFPLHPFFNEALSHFSLAPSQLTPNSWRILLGFVVLCHFAGVPPSLAVFRHFFSLRRSGWCVFRCRRGGRALFTGLTSPKSEREWKRGFFLMTSPEPWRCPVRWGDPPSKISTASPVLWGEEKKLVAKLENTHGTPVDLRTYLSETNLAAAFSSNLAGASPPPLLQPSPRSTGSQGMDVTAHEAVAPLEKGGAEPVGDTPQLSGKKRKHEEVTGTKDGLRRSEQDTPPATPPGLRAPPVSVWLATGSRAPPGSDPNPRHLPVPDTHDGDSATWEEARKILESIVTPSREREFAAGNPSDVVASTHVVVLQAVNYVSFALNYAQELEKKQTAQERDAAALREQLENAKAELTAAKAKLEKARAELAAARRAAEAEVQSAKTAAVQEFLGSEEYTRRVAEQALAAYERGAEEMKQAALRLNPRLDASKLILPID